MQIPWYIGWPIVIAFAVGILFIVASRAPYYPIKYPNGFWELQSKLVAEDVWILTSDGVRLHAWWVKAPQASLVTLYLHGNAGNLTHRFLPIREITAAGSSILMLDYRGYGKSGGSPSEHGLYTDADAAYLYLLSHGYHAQHIVLQGESWAPPLLWILHPEKRVLAWCSKLHSLQGAMWPTRFSPSLGP